MFKAILIIVIVIAVVLGGLLTLRNSGRTGLPSEDVLKRASARAREQDAAEKKDD
jgi:hypothetical protein